MTLAEDVDIDASEQLFRNVQNDYKKGVDFAHQWLDFMTVPDPSSAPAAAKNCEDNDSDTVNAQTLYQDLIIVLNVPRLETDKFSGDPLRYQTFMDAFDEFSTFSTTLDPDVIAVHRTSQFWTDDEWMCLSDHSSRKTSDTTTYRYHMFSVISKIGPFRIWK